MKFDAKGFLEYMYYEFPTPMECPFTRGLLANVVDDLMERYDDSTYLAHALSEIVPEIEEEEVLRFCKQRKTERGDVTVRLIFLNEGTGMGGELLVFQTDAPAEELQNLEKESNRLYEKGEDVPIWADVLSQKGYVFDFVDNHAHVNAWKTSGEWAEEKYPSVDEEYTIGN